MKNIFFSILVFSASGLTACSTLAPKESEINAQAAKAYEEVKAKSKISNNAEWTAMVRRVSQRIAASSGENFQWEYILIDSPEVNAWCMPGGKMAVYTGIMKVVKTEGALAAVMGHEVAHATLRHGKERYARAMSGNLIGVAVAAAATVGGQIYCKTDTCRNAAMIGGAAGGLAVAFFDRKFSRGDESEADQVGQMYMAKAGYDPAEAIELWKRMGAASGGKAPPEFMSTHPSDVRRRSDLAKWLPAAEAEYQKAPTKYGTGAVVQ